MIFNNLEEQTEKVEERLMKHQGLCLENDMYMIRAFKSFQEISDEGKTLKHAIIHYAVGRYSRGDDYLFALRPKKKLEIPYASLEFSRSGDFIMAKKEHNANADEKNELEFIERFRTEILLPFIEKENEENDFV
ncbi:MAG TPA: hypothetical protein DEB10_08255 [Ruminococcaceae bacterium]|jgi:hypothetical protein|nr:hypothetical protein [Oscillospiraceae bacterium]